MCAAAQTDALREQKLPQAFQRNPKKGTPMKTIQKFAVSAVAASFLLGLGGCSGMSARDQNTAVGAGVGAVGGALLTGSPVGVIGGAVVGGVIGHEVGR
jgi:osmotically inducible lipoprotein OsmB